MSDDLLIRNFQQKMIQANLAELIDDDGCVGAAGAEEDAR